MSMLPILTSGRCLSRLLLLLKQSLNVFEERRQLHLSSSLNKTVAGRYKRTPDRSRPLTYEMSLIPEEIGKKKDFNSYNTAQLEDTFLMKEEMGQDLPHKMFMEDLFIRRFMRGTFPEAVVSEVVIKRQHNLVRIAAIMDCSIQKAKMYFLIGYTEELLSYFLKSPVRLELQTVDDKSELVVKYI